MGIFDRFRLDFDDDDADDATPSEELLDSAYESDSTSRARDVGDFNFDPIDSTSVKGREIATAADNGEVYAGEWVREMFENAAHEPTQPTWIGYEEARNPLEGVTEVSIMHDELTSHMAVFGASGNGKSTLLVNMLVQWAYAGYGYCFIDPKGQDSYKLMQKLPEHRLDDVIWIEPGSIDHDKVIGLNFLDTHSEKGDPNFDNEVEQVINDLIPILRDQQNGWGATMSSVVQNITRRMLEDEKNYSVLDIYYLLNDPDYREDIPEYYDPEEQFTLKQKAEAISNMDQEEIEPLLRRFQTMAESRSTREVVAHKESDIDPHNIVNNNKIIILRASEADDSVQQIVATTIMRKIWSVISQRSKSEDNDPYFLVADEFHKLTDSANNIDDMLSTGRSLGLSVTLSTQQPRQLGDLVEVLGNVRNFISFNPGAQEDANFLKDQLRTEAENLMGLPKYMGYVNVGIGNQEESGPVRTHMFAPYPPLRTQEEAENAVAGIVEEYGNPPLLDKEISFDQHPLAQTATTSDGTAAKHSSGTYVVTDDDHEITEKALLKCIFDAQLKQGGIDEYVTRDDVAKQIGQLLDYDIDDDYGAKLSNAFEELPNRYLDVREGSEVRFRLEEEARDLVFNTSSGESGSAGFEKHRRMLEDAYIQFGRFGYNVDVLEQEGEMADGIARPPINPDEADSYAEARELDHRLSQEYPRLYELFGPKTLHLEAEGATLDKPQRVFKNLRKALEANAHCVYLVRDGVVDGNDFAANAEKIEDWIENKNFVKKITEGNRVFYNYSKYFTFDDGAVAARPVEGDGDSHATWREDGDRLILESPYHVDEPYAKFSDPQSLDNYTKGDFPYTYIRDNSQNVIRLYNTEGGITLEEEYGNRDQMIEDGFSPIPQPFIPERDLPNWDENNGVSDDAYTIIILPANDSPASGRGPRIYEDGETRALFPEDDEDTPFTMTASPDQEEIMGTNNADTETTEEAAGTTPSSTPTTNDTQEENEETEEDGSGLDNLEQVITEEAEESEVEVRDKRSIDDGDKANPTSENEESEPANEVKQDVTEEATEEAKEENEQEATNETEADESDESDETDDSEDDSQPPAPPWEQD